MWIMERLKDHDSADDESSPTETPFDDREAKLEKIEKDEEGEKIWAKVTYFYSQATLKGQV